jgi:TolA-binding protein
MKRKWLILLALASIAGGIALGFWLLTPRTAEAAYARAEKTEVKLDEVIAQQKRAAAPDGELIGEIENRIRDGWRKVLADWPGTAEAAKAAHRLLARELAQTADPNERIKLIDDFLAAHPEHAEKKNLLWRKAEILRDEVKDPLGAVAAFAEIEKQFPEDPIAPKAAMASAKIFESIGEHAAAAKAYMELADKYPKSPEAEEAQMRRASLLEEKLDRKREAAEVYEEVAKSNPGSASGRMAERQRRRLMGELGQSEQDEYYKKTYRVTERNPLSITKEELNSPAMQRLRSQGFDIRHYDVLLRLKPETSEMEVEAAIHGRLEKKLGEPLFLQLNPAMQVSRAELAAGGELKREQRGPYLELILPDDANLIGEDVTIEIDYAGSVGTWFGDGLTTSGASLRTESKWYPQTHFGDPFTQKVTIECPEEYRGIAQGVEIAPAEGAPAGWRRFAYSNEHPSQFMTIAMGRYERLEFEGPRGTPMEIALAPEHKDSLEKFKITVAESVEVYEEIFGPFPYPKLSVAEVPAFPGGYGSAMLILVGSIAFGGEDPPDKFLAHEVAHQWWGNLISLDLTEGSIPWLSEGFATYADAVYSERREGRAAFLNQIRTMGNFYRENILSFQDRPIAETLWDSPMYRSLMYEKGALVLHSLRREMGDEKFFALLKNFLDSHKFKIVRVKDFSEAASAAMGDDMQWFFDQNLGREGYARVKIQDAKAASSEGAWTLDLTLAQEAPPYRLTLDVAIETADGKEERHTVDLREESQTANLKLAAEPRKIRLDPDTWHLLDRRESMIEKTLAPDSPE